MAKSPSRPHPKPKVATGKSPKFNKTSGREYSGTSATKSPTGSRTTPTVPKHTATPGKAPGKTKAPIKHTSMPAPHRAARSKDSSR